MGFFGNFILVRFFFFLFFSFFFFVGRGGGGGTGKPRDLESFSLPHSHIPVTFSQSAEPSSLRHFPRFALFGNADVTATETIDSYTSDNGAKNIKAMGYILVQ